MLDKLTESLDFHGKALILRSERQRTIASNIANADTPGYAARDFDFARAMQDATASSSAAAPLAMTASQSGSAGNAGTANSSSSARHISLTSSTSNVSMGGSQAYTLQTQPSMDNNSVDLDRERASFVDNSIRYEATLRFINGNAKTILSAIQGQ